MADDELLEAAADILLVQLSEVDEQDEARTAALREECLAHLYEAPPGASFCGMTRDEAIIILEWGRDRGGPLTAGRLRDHVRRLKGEIARGGHNL